MSAGQAAISALGKAPTPIAALVAVLVEAEGVAPASRLRLVTHFFDVEPSASGVVIGDVDNGVQDHELEEVEACQCRADELDEFGWSGQLNDGAGPGVD